LRYTHAGERVRESTRTPVREEAEGIARAHIDRAIDGPGAEPWTLEEAIEATFALRWAGLRSEGTVRLNTGLLLRYFGAGVPVESIDLAAYTGLVRWLQERGASDSTINKKTSTLRTVLRTAADAGKLPGGVPRLPHRKEGRGRVRFASDAEERELLRLLRQWDQGALTDYLTFMLDTGLRRGEALGLEWRDVDLVARKVHLWETKTSTPRTVPLTARALAALGAPGEPRALVWERLGPTRSRREQRIRHWWDRAAGAMGLDGDPQWVPYVTRHTCASRLVMAGFHLRRVMDWMGHKNITTTMVYAHLAADALDDGARRLEARKIEPEVPHLRRVK